MIFVNNYGRPKKGMEKRNQYFVGSDTEEKPKVYVVQVGTFKNRNVAETVLSELEKDGYSGFITTKDAR